MRGKLLERDIGTGMPGFAKSVVHQDDGRIGGVHGCLQQTAEKGGSQRDEEAPKVAFGARLRQGRIHGRQISVVAREATSLLKQVHGIRREKGA